MGGPSRGKPSSMTPPEGRLDSWKAIAAYLNRDAKTAQRWEKREGMPVHRPHDKGGSVYALTAELDTWLHDRRQKQPVLARWLWLAGAVLVVGTGVYVLKFRPSPQPRHQPRYSIVIADFDNRTGDSVFEGTLRQGLSAQLDQSPFLYIFSDEQVASELRFMSRPAEYPLTRGLARQVCERLGGAAVLNGSIARIGSQYSLVLDAVDCSTDTSLARVETVASDKNHILSALGTVASTMRRELGESQSTTERFNTPIEQVTTPSLEALRAYSLGIKSLYAGNYDPAVASFQHAVSLDANFAMAYARLGAILSSDNRILATVYLTKAYSLRDRGSERERFYISSHYFNIVTGDLQKAKQVYDLWARTYPRDKVPVGDLGEIYSALGQYGEAVEALRHALKMTPRNDGVDYENLVKCYIFLNRPDEAATALAQARAHGINSPFLHLNRYELAFLQGDTATMTREAVWGSGKPGIEDVFLYHQSDTAAYVGQIAQANDLSARAVASAGRTGEKETAAGYQAEEALREAVIGDAAEARGQAAAALKISNGRDTEAAAALALALAGDAAQAQQFADDLAKRYSEDTAVQFNYLPEIHAAIELHQHAPANAIADLQAASPYELGWPALMVSLNLYPVYVRGLAYLGARQGVRAAAEFQKIFDHRGVVTNEIIAPLARLGLARARALSGDKPGARKAYQDFLALWQHADPGIPVLNQAKSEYAKLQ